MSKSRRSIPIAIQMPKSRPLEKLWSALETAVAVNGLAGVRAEWMSMFGPDWAWGQHLLRATDEVAASYPNLAHEPRTFHAYNVVCHDADRGDYVGICPEGFHRIPLSRAKLAVYEVDLEELADRIAKGLQIVPDCIALADLPHAWRIGAYKPKDGEEAWIYLALAPSDDVLRAIIAGLAVRQDTPFILLTPTRSLWRAWHETLRREGAVVALGEIITLDDQGRLITVEPPGALLEKVLSRTRSRHVSRADASIGASFRREGQGWRIVYDGTPITLKDSVGIRYIRFLIADPGALFHASELLQHVNPDARLSLKLRDSGVPCFDAEALANARRTYRELVEDAEDAKRNSDIGAQLVAGKKIAELWEVISAGEDRRGRSRRIGDLAERARKAVCNAIDRALEAAEEEHLSLWRHLDGAIHLGTYLIYDPSPRIRWEL